MPALWGIIHVDSVVWKCHDSRNFFMASGQGGTRSKATIFRSEQEIID